MMMNNYEPKMYDVLKLLHPTVREQGEQILHALLCGSKILNWDRFLRVYYNERPIHKSNLVDLLNYILYPYDSDSDEPRGYDEFLNGLSDVGIEPEWIENEDVRDALEEMMDDSSSDLSTIDEEDEESSGEEGGDSDGNDSAEEDETDEEESDEEENKEIQWEEFQSDESE